MSNLFDVTMIADLIDTLVRALDTCVSINVADTDPSLPARLIELGWKGIAGDGREALYAPRCF